LKNENFNFINEPAKSEKMRRKVKSVIRLVWPLLTAFAVCEYLIYWPVLWNCHYPGLGSKKPSKEPFLTSKEPLKAMVLADTHLLGRRQGHWFDKLRREWQMRRTFQTAYSLFHPRLVIFLGDLFDEGKWAKNEEFEETVGRFKDMFAVDEGTEVTESKNKS